MLVKPDDLISCLSHLPTELANKCNVIRSIILRQAIRLAGNQTISSSPVLIRRSTQLSVLNTAEKNHDQYFHWFQMSKFGSNLDFGDHAPRPSQSPVDEWTSTVSPSFSLPVTLSWRWQYHGACELVISLFLGEGHATNVVALKFDSGAEYIRLRYA